MERMIRFRVSILLVLLLSILLVTAHSNAAPAQAGGTVTNCSDDSDFSSKLAGGGTITFNCGTATIPFNSTKGIIANTLIDGGGTISLSGQNAFRLFVVYNGYTLTLKNITLRDGYNSTTSGGIVTNNGSLVLDRVTMHGGNAMDYSGGAISTHGALDISNSILYDNRAKWGGAIIASGASTLVNIDNTTFFENKATGTTQNVDGFGGAIYGYNGATINISASNIHSNLAESGGGIYMGSPSTLTVETSQISNNAALTKGGGIYNSGSASVSQSSLTGNHTQAVSNGGGIANYGELTITQSTLNNNESYAGGALNNYYGTSNLTNVTLSGNTVTAYGGGINNYAGTVNLTNVTLFGNTGGILNQNNANTHLNLKNVVVANSQTQNNCDFGKAPDTSDHNLSSDASCNFLPGGGGDSLKLKLGALDTNGGNTATHRLLPGSPAIDKGVFVNSILTDQRSITRPRGSAFDVGAVEFVPCAGAPTKPVLLSPIGGAHVQTQAPVLDWAGPDCVKNFSVLVRQGSKTGPVVFSKGKTKRTQVKTTLLSKNQKYFWRVTACNGKGCAQSGWGKFKVP